MFARFLACAMLLVSALEAGSLNDFTRSCFQRANFSKGKYWLEECIEELFTLEPVHPAIYTIAPGTGPAFGLGFHMVRRDGRVEFLPTALLVASPDHSFLAQAELVIAAPPLSVAPVWRRDSTGGEHQHGRRTLSLVSDSANVDAKASLTLRARRLEASQQSFYGLGQDAPLSGLAPYALRQNEAGVALNDPITYWSSIGLTLDYLQPRAGDGRDSESSINARYGTSLPGLGSRNNFLRTEPYFQFRVPTRGSNFVNIKLGYQFTHDLDGGRYSFQRFQARAHTNFNILLPSHTSPTHRSGIANFLCPGSRSRENCTPGSISFNALADISYTGKGSQVPFYFDGTLGGTDITGNDTLRGFADYRFRGPSRILFQAEYRHNLWGPIGFLSFYDIGKVGILPSDLALQHLKHDEGIGIFLQAANRIVLRVYLGFGSGEGMRPNYKLPSAY